MKKALRDCISRVVYLHGFASSPQSSKAQFFAGKFQEEGIEFVAPVLEEGSFERLTLTRMLRVVEKTVDDSASPCLLMGSSLGGYLAALFASRHPEKVQAMVLLAPAFSFAQRWNERLSPAELAEWKRQGTRPFFHYGQKRDVHLGYEFVEDAAGYEPEPDGGQPTLILHGSNDPVVPVESSRRYADARSKVQLHELHSAHELTDVMPELWQKTTAFLDSLC